MEVDPRNLQKPQVKKSLVVVKPGLVVEDRICQLSKMYKHLDSADVSIVCGRNHDILKGHRFALSDGSAYCRDALRAAPCEHPIVVVKHIPGDVMGWILEYIYQGQVTFQSELEFEQFWDPAKYLKLSGLQDDLYPISD